MPPDALLVAVHVEALYSSIPHQQGIKDISHVISQSHKDNRPFDHFLLLALEHILTRNVFSFDGSHYLHVQGVAMETCCAPSYSNPYLGRYKNHNFRKDASSMYRCMNKVFIIWEGTNNALDDFLVCLNMDDLNMKINVLCDRNQISFFGCLDL